MILRSCSGEALFKYWMIRDSFPGSHPAETTSSIGRTQPPRHNGDLKTFPSGGDKTTNPFAHKKKKKCSTKPLDKYYEFRVGDLLGAGCSRMAFHWAQNSGRDKQLGASLGVCISASVDGWWPSVQCVLLITPNPNPCRTAVGLFFLSAALCPPPPCFSSSCPDFLPQRP